VEPVQHPSQSLSFTSTDNKMEKLQKQLDEFQAFIDWITSIGITLNPSSRVYKYREYLQKHLQAVKDGTLEELKQLDVYRQYTAAFFDVQELLTIYTGFKNVTINEEIRNRLDVYASGPTNIYDENPQNSSTRNRNIGFELYLSSRLQLAGYPIIFSPSGDIELSIDKHNVYIECKRPFNEKKLMENVDKAIKQLIIRRSNSTLAKTFVAISISKFSNLDHDTLRIKDRDSMFMSVKGLFEEFLERNRNAWELCSKNDITGAIVLFQVPCDIESEYKLEMSNYLAPIMISQREEDRSSFRIYILILIE
jgi:hypothetical protein